LSHVYITCSSITTVCSVHSCLEIYSPSCGVCCHEPSTAVKGSVMMGRTNIAKTNSRRRPNQQPTMHSPILFQIPISVSAAPVHCDEQSTFSKEADTWLYKGEGVFIRRHTDIFGLFAPCPYRPLPKARVFNRNIQSTSFTLCPITFFSAGNSFKLPQPIGTH
jgi:hypothetical protein